MTGQDIASFQHASLDDRWRYAQAIANAGNLVPPGLRDGNTMNPGKVLMAMEQAVVLGFHPMVGVNNINVIEGKVSLPPALMQAAVRNAGHTLRVKMSGTVEGGDLSATATLIRADDPDYPFEVTWTPHRAARAGLCTYAQDRQGGPWLVRSRSKNGSPLPWEAYTEAMLKARAISEVCREGAADVLMGSVYVPEELGMLVAESGESTGEAAGPPVPENSQTVIDAQVEEDGSDWAAEIEACETADHIRALWFVAQKAGQFGVNIGGVTVKEAIERRGQLLAEQEQVASAPGTAQDGTNAPESEESPTADDSVPAQADSESEPESSPEPDPEGDAADEAWLKGESSS